MLSMAAPAQSAMIRLSYEHRWLFAGKEIVHDYILHTSADKSMFYNPVAYQLDTTSKDEATELWRLPCRQADAEPKCRTAL